MNVHKKEIPICANCPIRTGDFDERLADFDDSVLIEAREMAVNSTYNTHEATGAPWKLERIIINHGVNKALAGLAVDCLGYIQRRYCLTADYDLDNEGLMHVVHRSNDPENT